MRFISALTLLLLVVTGPHSLALASEPGTGSDSGATTSESVESPDSGNDAGDSSVSAEEPSSEEGAPEGRETAEGSKEGADETPVFSEDTTTEPQPQENPAPNNGVTITDDSDTRVIEIACDDIVGDHTEALNGLESLTVSWSSSCDAPEATPSEGITISDQDDRTASVALGTELAFTAFAGSLTIVFEADNTENASGGESESDTSPELPPSESDSTSTESPDTVPVGETGADSDVSEESSAEEQHHLSNSPANGVTITDDGLDRALYVNCDEIVGTHEYVVTTDEVRTLTLAWHPSCATRTVTPEDGLTNDGSGSVSWEVSPGAAVKFSRSNSSATEVIISFVLVSHDGSSPRMDSRSLLLATFGTFSPQSSSSVVTVDTQWLDNFNDVELKFPCSPGVQEPYEFRFSPQDSLLRDGTRVIAAPQFSGDCSAKVYGIVQNDGSLTEGGWTPQKFGNSDILEADRWARYTTLSGQGITIIFSDISPATVPRLIQLSPINGTVGEPIQNQSVLAEDFIGVAPTFSAPDLPSGLVIDPQTGVISGTPEILFGTQDVTITATNGEETATTTVEVTVLGYIISFNTQGNLDAPVGSVASKEAFPGNEIKLPTPGIASNHVFDGWYTDATEGERVGFGGDPYVPQASTELFARWLPRVDINFYLGGGEWPSSGPATEQADGGCPSGGGTCTYEKLGVAEGTTVTMPVPTKSNFGFMGWRSSNEPFFFLLGGEEILADDIVNNLIAEWQEEAFSVDFNPSGGVVDDSRCSAVWSPPQCRIQWAPGDNLASNGRPQLETPTPTRQGHQFAGWFDEASGGNRVAGGAEIITPDSEPPVTLVAKWAEVAEPVEEAPTPPSVNEPPTPPVVSPPTQPGGSGNQPGSRPGGQRGTTVVVPILPVAPNPVAPAPVFPREPVPPVTPAPPTQQTPAPTPTPAPSAPAPALPPRTADTGSVLQRNLEQPSGTVDFGSGVQSSGGATQGTPGATRPTVEVPVRTPGEKRAEVLQGFAPGSTTEIEVVGSRTGARFVLSTQAASDKEQVAQAMAASTTSSSTDFFEVRSVQAVSAPEPKPSWDDSERNVVSSLFESSGLPTPKSLNDFDLSGFTEWVKIESEAKTYVPGSTVYLTVTSEPIVIGQAKVNASGDAELVGTIPAELLSAGEHRIRLIGIRLLDGVSVDEDGNVQVSDATMAEIQRFDQGTQVTVAVLGQNPEGEQHTALRIVALPADARVSWWPLWLIVGAFGAFVLARTRGLLGQPIRRSIGLGVVGASALPAIVIGVASGVLALTWWGVAAGLLALGLAFFVPHRDPGAETA